jgi:uncharacterized protein (DUF305 family)
MVAPMMAVMLWSMRSMFPSKLLNGMTVAGAALVFIGSFAAMHAGRLGDVQFLKSMIPHHSSAILMCEQSALSDPEIIALYKTIVESQSNEIARMQQMLRRY